jgi:hypothetical protein
MRQQMSNLPAERLTPDKPPFCYVGVDYFGPLSVKHKRSLEKRYGCLFTCLTTQAVHLEVAHSLDTESFLCAVSRFIARRGFPEKIFSDNGTNLTLGCKELKKGLSELDVRKINEKMLQNHIEWKFNPPHASHMGGIWERMIRSIKTILSSMLSEQNVCDETLLTVFAEVELILNSRPITQLSDDTQDPQPLTPNHLLLLQPRGCYPPRTFSRFENYYNRDGVKHIILPIHFGAGGSKNTCLYSKQEISGKDHVLM